MESTIEELLVKFNATFSLGGTAFTILCPTVDGDFTKLPNPRVIKYTILEIRQTVIKSKQGCSIYLKREHACLWPFGPDTVIVPLADFLEEYGPYRNTAYRLFAIKIRKEYIDTAKRYLKDLNRRQESLNYYLDLAGHFSAMNMSDTDIFNQQDEEANERKIKEKLATVSKTE